MTPKVYITTILYSLIYTFFLIPFKVTNTRYWMAFVLLSSNWDYPSPSQPECFKSEETPCSKGSPRHLLRKVFYRNFQLAPITFKAPDSHTVWAKLGMQMISWVRIMWLKVQAISILALSHTGNQLASHTIYVRLPESKASVLPRLMQQTSSVTWGTKGEQLREVIRGSERRSHHPFSSNEVRIPSSLYAAFTMENSQTWAAGRPTRKPSSGIREQSNPGAVNTEL